MNVHKYCLIVKKREILKGVRVNVRLIIIFIGSIMQLITTRKLAHNHMIIKLINIAYVTKFLYHASLGTKSHGARETFTNLYMASDAIH